MSRKITECDKELAFNLMEQAYNLGSREIGFYMVGEPFLKKDLAEFVAHSKKIGYTYTYITTNGALATLNRMKEVINAGLDSIKFSINAATRESYMKVHGKDDFETVKNNVNNLHDYLKQNHIELAVFISFIRTTITTNEVSILHNEFSHLVDNIYVFDAASQGTPMFELVKGKIVSPEIYLKTSSNICDMVFNRIHITSEGYLDACCVDFDNVLNAVDLHKTSLADAWNSEVMQDLRQRFLTNNLEGMACYNCIHKIDEPIKPLI